jgi:hypothetical protein
MAWSLKSLAQNITDILKANAPPRIAMGQDPTADPAVWNPVVVASDGSMRASSYSGMTQYASSAAEACVTLKASPGMAAVGCIYNEGGATAYLQFHNTIAAPAPGAAPAAVLAEIATVSTIQLPTPVRGSTGVTLALSSTRDTYTAYANGHFLIWWS